jgi:hypothetical protein
MTERIIDVPNLDARTTPFRNLAIGQTFQFPSRTLCGTFGPCRKLSARRYLFPGSHGQWFRTTIGTISVDVSPIPDDGTVPDWGPTRD